MKIGIYGSYSKRSLGDHYILDGIINQVRSNFEENIDIVVFTYSPNSTKKLLDNTDISVTSATPTTEAKTKSQENTGGLEKSSKYTRKMKGILDSKPNLWFCFDPLLISNYKFWNEKWRMIQDLDLFLFGGGNILMDLYPYSVPYHYIYSKLADISDTPAMYYSTGAGPFRSIRGRFYFNRTLKNIRSITTRDKESLQLVENTLNTKETRTKLAADPAVCLNSNKSVPKDIKNNSPADPNTTHIAVSLVPYYKKGYWPDPEQERYQEYIKTMAEALTKVTTNRDASLTFFATNHPNDIETAEQTLEQMDNDVSARILQDRLTGEELVSWLSNYDIAFCTRLHSLIPTFVAGTPFVAYAYQPKVQYFSNRIGYPDQAIDLSLDNDEIIARTQQALATAEEWSGEIPNHEKKLEALRVEANKSVKLAKKIMRENTMRSSEV